MKIFARLLVLVAVLPVVLAPVRASAQASAAWADITPYAGWLVTGNFLEGPLGVSLSTAGGPMYGVQASVALAPGVAVFGNVASSKADLRIGLPFVGGVSVGEMETLIYDGGVRLTMRNSLGRSTAVTPFVQLGVGAMRHVISASVLETRTTNVAFNAGVGAHVSLADGVGLRVLAVDYIGRFDAKEATMLDLEARTTHNFGFVGGITFSF